MSSARDDVAKTDLVNRTELANQTDLVLVVDDDEAGRYTKVRILRRAGYEVIEAGTGYGGFRLTGERRPALVVLDVKLPDISGLEICKFIKRDYPGTMVLQTSASFVTSEDRVRGLEGGADNYLTQPVDPRELVAAVRALLRLGAAEQSLRDSERRYRLILESATDYAIVATDLEGRVVTWNTGAENVLGWREREILGEDVRVIWTPEDQAQGAADAEMRDALAEGRAIDERWHQRKDGSRFWAAGLVQPMRDDGGEVRGFLKILRDRTEQRRLEEERERAESDLRRLNETLEQRVAVEVAERAKAEESLRQAQKMEAVGQLTGGIAHDFNNLLQIVTGNLEILSRNLPEDAARLRRLADSAMTGAKRAAILTQRLLAFSRRQPLAPKPIDVNTLVKGMSDLLGRTLGETIAIETVLAGGLWRTEADPNQLESTLLNLAVNARDAMPDGGKLTIETSNGHLDREYAAHHAEVTPGQYVVICVTDTGTGMSEEVLARVFEPFFTTKEVGKGTGLGLAQVYGFVKQSGGHVKIYSEPGEGTTVKVYLPRLFGAATEEAAAAERLASPGGTRAETVLVLEDDDEVRAFSVEVLRELGYRVLEAHDGRSALRLLEAQSESIDLLFTDVVLPAGMTGAQTAERARALRPGLKVLFTTGYARNAIVHHGRLDAGVELITKPFSYADLAGRVRDILDGTSAG